MTPDALRLSGDNEALPANTGNVGRSVPVLVFFQVIFTDISTVSLLSKTAQFVNMDFLSDGFLTWKEDGPSVDSPLSL